MENKLNIPPFYVGQKVVYITGVNMPKDSIHTVSDIGTDPCGCVILYIDGQEKKKITGDPAIPNFKCARCKKSYPKKGTVVYSTGWDPNSFRPVQEQPMPLMTFSQIKEKEKEEILLNN